MVVQASDDSAPLSPEAPADAETPTDAAVELLARLGGELPVLAGLTDPRLALLVAGWLSGFHSPRTRRAYAGDLAAFHSWCDQRGLAVLTARRVALELHVTGLLDAGAAAASVARRLSALGSFYRFTAAAEVIEASPVTGVRRPAVDPDATATVGLSVPEARALIAAADTDHGPAALRSAALIRLLLHTALRVDELTSARLEDLGADRGHTTLDITRKGGRRARIALAPATVAALHDYLDHRAHQYRMTREALAARGGPLLATRTGARLHPREAWRVIRRLARTAEIPTADRLSPHSLRHTAITAALEAGAALRDVQDWAGHRDPRTTRRYDHARATLDRSPTYTLAATLA